MIQIARCIRMFQRKLPHCLEMSAMRALMLLPPLIALALMLVICDGYRPQQDDHNGQCHSTNGVAELVKCLDFVQYILPEDRHSSEDKHYSIDCADGDCSDILTISPRSRVIEGPLDVSCDSKDDGGGWTIFQRRGDYNSAVDYFYRDWNSYKNGFGNIKEDFWIGNDNLYALTNQRACTLKIVMSDWEGNTTDASYDDFWIDDEQHNYTLHVSGYRGTAGDSFSDHNGFAFTTKDRKNNNSTENCAVAFKGAWWYSNCHESNLNGYYLRGIHKSKGTGVNWYRFKGHKYSLKETVMKIKPKNFKKNCTKF